MDNGEIWSLIARYVAGSISAGDEKRLQDWAAADPYNRKVLDEAIRVWGITGKRLTLREPDTQQEWLALMARINTAKQNPVRQIFLQIPYAVRIAAILILAVALYVVIRQTETSVTPYPRSLSIRTTTDSVKWFYLPDGSRVWLNTHTTLSFDSLFIERKTWLEGEAFFDVVHKNNVPFTVDAGDVRVTVAGTSFNVKSQHNGNIDVVVVTGKVKFESTDIAVQKKYLLAVQDKGTYIAKERLLTVTRNGDHHFLDWKRKAEERDSLGSHEEEPARDSVATTTDDKNKAALNEEADQTDEEEDGFDAELDKAAAAAAAYDSSDVRSRKISSFHDLTNAYSSKRDAIKRTVIAGSITNTSSTVSYRKIRLKITAVTSKGKKSEYSMELSSTKPLQPGQSVRYQQTLFDVASKKTEVQVSIVEAQIIK